MTIGDEIRDAARILERYDAPTRYPDALGGLDPSRVFNAADAVDAIERASRILSFAKSPTQR